MNEFSLPSRTGTVTGEGRSTNGLLTLTYYAAADGKEEEIAAQ